MEKCAFGGSNKYFSMTPLFTRLWLSAEVHLQTYTRAPLKPGQPLPHPILKEIKDFSGLSILKSSSVDQKNGAFTGHGVRLGHHRTLTASTGHSKRSRSKKS
jgi:hypothetical protein